MKKEDVIAKLRDVKPVLSKKYGLAEVALFGSYSRGEQTDKSDIDLLVDFNKTDIDDFFNCAFALEDLFKPKKVQIVTKGGIKPRYFEAIKQDLIYA